MQPSRAAGMGDGAPGRSRARAVLALAPRARHGRVRAGRPERHHRTRLRGAPRRDLRPALRRREPHRRRRQSRRGSGGARGTGRHHAHARLDRTQRRQSRAVCEASLRPGARPRHGEPRRHRQQRARAAPERARSEREGARRSREGPARQAHLRFLGQRLFAAPCGRALQADDGRGPGARALQGRGARDDRPRIGPGAHELRPGRERGAVRQGRETQAPRAHRREALGVRPRHAHPGGERVARIRRVDLVRDPGHRRHARGSRQPAPRRARENRAEPATEGAARQHRHRRGGERLARRGARLPCGGGGEMGEARARDRGESGVVSRPAPQALIVGFHLGFFKKIFPEEVPMRFERHSFVATAILTLAFAAYSAGAAAQAALAGQVASAEEGAMEGVLVSAKKAGSTITITVVSDVKGRYSFPAAKLDPGRYAIRIRAVGYDLEGPGAADVAPGKAATLDLKLKKTSDLAAQLSNGEWMASVPGNDQQKGLLLNCVGCHTLERVARSAYDADAFTNAILPRMQGYVNQSIPQHPQLRKAERLMEERGDQRVQVYRSTAEYLATINLGEGKEWGYPLKT